MEKTALVTGAASGIGRSIAFALASEKMNLVLVDRDDQTLSTVVSSLNDEGIAVEGITADVAEAANLEAALTEVLGRTSIDVLVNNAGTAVAANVVATTREQWHRIFDVNIHAIFETSRLLVPHMISRGGGSIVNIASVAALVGLESRAAYCASKGAVVSLTRAMAVDHAKDGIRVNAVCPGTVLTGWIDGILADNPQPEQARKVMEERQLLGRLGDPNEIAAAVVFLVRNSFVTGSALVVDGGMTAR